MGLMRALGILALALPTTLVASWPLLAANEPARQPHHLSQVHVLEAGLLADAADGGLEQHSILSAALIASGVQDERRLELYQQRMRNWQTALDQEAASVESQRDRAATVLAFLYREVLTGPYDAGCGELSATFDTGRYNCVTASIMYWIFADSLELAPRGWHSPGHVRIKLNKPAALEVETTCRAWFSHANGPQSATAGRELSPVALVAKLYYNQGVQALERSEFVTASGALERSLQLDPLDIASQRNLLAAMNNGALALCQQQRFAAALELLASARRIDPQYGPVLANEWHIRQRWVVTLCEAKRFAEAIEVLTPRRDAVGESAAIYTAGRVAVYQLWAEDLARRGETHAALAKVEQGLAIAPEHAALQSLRRELRG